jgi:ABC-type phosphate transport system substrate-binding protein
MKILILMLSVLFGANAFADVVVIVHPSNNNTITQADLEPLFMVKKSTFADGSKATPYYLVADDAARNLFDDKVLGKSSGQLKAYWSKLVFTGKGTPPAELANSAEAVAKVATDPTAIAYVSKGAVSSAVKVVLSLQ